MSTSVGDIEERSVQLAEAKAGVQLLAGHPVVLIDVRKRAPSSTASMPMAHPVTTSMTAKAIGRCASFRSRPVPSRT